MTDFTVPKPENDSIQSYAPGTPERKELKATLDELKDKEIEIPIIIGGQEIKTGNTQNVSSPTTTSMFLPIFIRPVNRR